MSRHPFDAIRIPPLPPKPRRTGLTAILDKGLGPAQVADLTATAGEWIDLVKLGWGTGRLQPRAVLETKIRTYRDAGVEVSTGGTFLEIAHAQGQVGPFLDGAKQLGFTVVEVSNGVHPMGPEEKRELITRVRAAGFRVWSEVGKKDPEEDARLSYEDRLREIHGDLEAGADAVILEARESGTLGIYDRSGRPAAELIHRLEEGAGRERLIFEAPQKSQQVWMIRTFGSEVNLGNIPPEDALSLATLRTGLRGDTFADVHLPGVDVFLEVGVNGALAARRRGGVVILIDALRASATIVTALAAGMASVRPVAAVGDCVAAGDDEVTAGERGGRKLPHVRHGNSPTELLREDYRGKTLVLTTSNGAECLLTAAAPETTVLVGTTLNASAAARAALRLARGPGEPGGAITLLMAGRNNRETLEDSLAAGEIFHALQALGGVRLHGDAPPSSSGLEADFFRGESGRNLARLGYGEDVSFCAQRDRYEVVGVYRDGTVRVLE